MTSNSLNPTTVKQCRTEVNRFRNGDFIKTHPQLIMSMMRDWHFIIDAGLHNMAWAMYQDAYVSTGDVRFILDELEKHLDKLVGDTK
jgi:hypothetical protein